ncbi:MAG: hypothetical protein AAGA86_05140 [Bacteroidota bacterium]
MKWTVSLVLILAVLGCRKSDPPPDPPSAVSLIFPERNSECNTGESISETISRVTFRWQASENTDSYELRVTNLNTGNTQRTFVETTSAALSIAKGVPFSWQVVSRNDQVTQTTVSESWFFYNQGSQTSFVPFPAEILQPLSSSKVFMDDNGEVALSWAGADLDNDISGYEVYLDLEIPPASLLASPLSAQTELNVAVSEGSVYYWRVLTRDEAGNTSDSGVHDFQVFKTPD